MQQLQKTQKVCKTHRLQMRCCWICFVFLSAVARHSLWLEIDTLLYKYACSTLIPHLFASLPPLWGSNGIYLLLDPVLFSRNIVSCITTDVILSHDCSLYCKISKMALRGGRQPTPYSILFMYILYMLYMYSTLLVGNPASRSINRALLRRVQWSALSKYKDLQRSTKMLVVATYNSHVIAHDQQSTRLAYVLYNGSGTLFNVITLVDGRSSKHKE